MARLWPIALGIAIVVFLALLPVGPHVRFMGSLLTLAATPVTVLAIQGRRAWLVSLVSLVTFGVLGLFVGWFAGPWVSELLVGPIPVEDNIRIDLVMWALVGTSLFASIGAFLGGEIVRRRHHR